MQEPLKKTAVSRRWPPLGPPVSDDAKFAEWHPPAPPDPQLRKRLRGFRWDWVLYALGVMVWMTMFYSAPPAAIGCGFVVYSFYWSVKTKRSPAGILALMDLPPNGYQFPVMVSYRSGDTNYGNDSGIVTVNRSWLIFEGLQSQFTLGRSDVASRILWARGSWNKASPKDQALVLQYELDERPFTVRIWAVDRIDGAGDGFRRKFCAQVETWKWGERANTGLALYPPLSAQPCMVRQTRFLYAFALLLLAGLTAFGFWMVVPLVGMMSPALATVTALPILITAFVATKIYRRDVHQFRWLERKQKERGVAEAFSSLGERRVAASAIEQKV